MNILIAGAGRVGFRLAKVLSHKNDVILIDKNEDALEKIQESIDVLTIAGNVEDPKSYAPIEDKKIDIFIAVTDTDETNLISSIVASEKINITNKKIIRLKKEFFVKSSIASKIGITDAVFPYMLTAQSIVSLLNYPKANNIKVFKNTQNKLISVKITSESHNLSVFQIDNDYLKVIGIDRNKQLLIPKGDEKLKLNDMVYLFGKDEEIEKIAAEINNFRNNKIKNIAIFGADILGIEIAKALIECDVNIKIIEKDLNKCKNASEILQNKAMIINSKYGDFRLYEDEGLKNANMVIATTSNDEENIIKCIEAKEHGVQKVVAINNDIEYYNLMHSLGVVTVRGPKINAFYSILETIGSSEIVNEKLFCGGSGISFIREIDEINKTIYPMNTQGVVELFLEDDKVELFHTKKIVLKKTTIIVFALLKKEEEVRKWINNL